MDSLDRNTIDSLFKPVIIDVASARLPREAFENACVVAYGGTTKEPSANGESTVHRFTTLDGDPFTLWGTYVLDRQLRHARPGQFIRLRYDGIEQIAGGKTQHNFSVAIGPTLQPGQLRDLATAYRDQTLALGRAIRALMDGTVPNET